MLKSRKSIANKYLKAFILIIVLPTLLISIFINRIYINTLLKNSSDMILQAMEQISISVDNEIKRISLTASTIANDDTIIDLVTQWNRSNDVGEKFNISKQIDSKLNYIFSNSGDVDCVIFFFKNEGAYCYKNSPILEEDEIKNMDWYGKTVERNGKVLALGSLMSFSYGSWDQYVLSVSISPNIPEIRNDVEAIYFGFRTNLFSSFNSSSMYKLQRQMFIIDSDDKIIASRNQEFMGKDIKEAGYPINSLEYGNSSFIKTINQKKEFISIHSIQKTKWKIVSIIDYSIITQDVDKISAYASIISATVLLFFFLFSIFFFREIIIPVKNMSQKMKCVEKGDFNTAIDIKRDDELSELGMSFNRMVQEIKKLIIERDTKERERNKAELEVLQSQINPHFMSNTLNAIRLMAMIAKVESIKNMTDAFIKLLSASFAKHGKFIIIKEEIENLKNYVYIMKIRYGDKFDVNINIEEEIENYYVLRLILQPIVENAILHGISELVNRGEINIRGYLGEKHIIFEVRDNGRGMTDQQIEKLMNEAIRNDKGFSRIGVKNVDKRIKLNHGHMYGLNIESVYGEYTLVKMELPVIMKFEEEDTDV